MEELKPKPRRGKTAEQKAEEAEAAAATARKELEEKGEYVSPLRADEIPVEETVAPVGGEPPMMLDEPGYLAALEAAAEVFGDDMKPESKAIVEQEIEATKAKLVQDFRPPKDVFITVQGGAQYLPARWRVVWLRRQVATAGWSIQTQMVAHVAGTCASAGGRGKSPKITGGMAVFKAVVMDDRNKIIGEGHAQEFSDNFSDYIEKAETSAIARALAISGFGTESALDLDEGWIADSPIKADGSLGSIEAAREETPIVIGKSEITNVMQGGRQQVATQAQMAAIREASNELSLPPDALAAFIDVELGKSPDLSEADNITEQGRIVLDFLAGLSFAECGKIVKGLMEAVEKQRERDGGA